MGVVLTHALPSTPNMQLMPGRSLALRMKGLRCGCVAVSRDLNAHPVPPTARHAAEAGRWS